MSNQASIALAPSGAAVDSNRAVTVAALMATYMEAVNISLPNAALPHIQGTLSMADDEVGWIFTAYLMGGAAVLPMARWLAGRYGRRTVFLSSLAAFSVALLVVPLARTPVEFVLARILHGAVSGPLAILSMAILLDVLPPERHARISVAWTASLLLGISTGPAIGGWLSEYHGWPSIFYFSLPIAGFIFLVMALSLPEKKAAQNPPFDFFGWATLLTGMIALQMLLDRGERLEWFSSGEIWIEALASALGFYLFTVHAVTAKVHFFHNALFSDRNFVVSAIMLFAAGFVLLPTLALTSPMLEEILNYPVDTSGYMTIPRGITLVGFLILMSFVPARYDSRLFVIVGVALVACAHWLMLGYSPVMDWRPVFVALLVQGAGLGILLPALGRTAFATLDPSCRPEGTALFTIARVYGGTIGIAIVQIFFYDNTQAVHLALAKDLAPFRAAAHVAASIARPNLAMLNDVVTQQSAMIAVIDQFKILMCAMLVVSPLVLLLRKPRPAN